MIAMVFILLVIAIILVNLNYIWRIEDLEKRTNNIIKLIEEQRINGK